MSQSNETQEKTESNTPIRTGNAKLGAKIFKTKCSQCHTIDKDGSHKQGS